VSGTYLLTAMAVTTDRSCVGSSGTSVGGGWWRRFVTALVDIGGYSRHCGQLALDVRARLVAKGINTNTLCSSGDTRSYNRTHSLQLSGRNYVCCCELVVFTVRLQACSRMLIWLLVISMMSVGCSTIVKVSDIFYRIF